MSTALSTGSTDLDALIEGLHLGDNVVFYGATAAEYRPFVAALASRLTVPHERLTYGRANGSLDAVMAQYPSVEVWELRPPLDGNAVIAMISHVEQGTQPGYLVLDPLTSLDPDSSSASELTRFFLTLCPLLYQRNWIAYWAIKRGFLGRQRRRPRLRTVLRCSSRSSALAATAS